MLHTHLYITGTLASMNGKLSRFQWKHKLLYKSVASFGGHFWEEIKRSLTLERRVTVL